MQSTMPMKWSIIHYTGMQANVYLRTGSWGEYFGPKGVIKRTRESFTMRNFRYWSPIRVIKSQRLKWAGHVVRKEKGRDAFKILTGTSTGKRVQGRTKCRREDSIKIDIKEICHRID